MKSATPVFALSVLAMLGLAACSSHERPPGPNDAKRLPAILFSPNGEPLNGGDLGQPSCTLAMDYWFDRIDANHDGRLDRDEFLADSDAQFAKMDMDRQGYVTSNELDQYRGPYRQGTRSANVADPVMAADVNLNGMVTPEEFRNRAADAFDQLDAAHKGYVEHADLAAYCTRLSKLNGDDTRRPDSSPDRRPGRAP